MRGVEIRVAGPVSGCGEDAVTAPGSMLHSKGEGENLELARSWSVREYEGSKTCILARSQGSMSSAAQCCDSL